MSFDLVYYNDNSFFVEDTINHFVVYNNVSNQILNLNKEEINFIANKVADITKNDKNITHEQFIKTFSNNIIDNTKNKNITNEQIIKIILFVIIISQMFLIFTKTKT